MPKYLVVFVAEGTITWWTEAYNLEEAEHICDEVPYHEPALGTGDILTECSKHGWRPADPLTGTCRDCYDLYMEFEFRQEADYYGPDTRTL